MNNSGVSNRLIVIKRKTDISQLLTQTTHLQLIAEDAAGFLVYILMKYFSRQMEKPMEDHIDLSAFEHTTKEEWIQKIEAELKGKSADQLSWSSFDGTSQVFSTKEDLQENQIFSSVSNSKGKSNHWNIEMCLSPLTWPFYSAIEGEGIDVLNIDAELFLAKGQPHLPKGSSIKLFLSKVEDPELLIKSKLPENLEGIDWDCKPSDLKVLSDLFAARKLSQGNYSLACANGYNWSNKGAYISQELAFAIAEGHDLLVELMKNGNSIDEVSDCIQFKMGIGNSFFKEIAKFRALRGLWSSVVSAYNPSDEKSKQTKIRAYNSSWNKTAVDEQTNLLRTTTEAMSAIMGGVDTLCVMPHDSMTEATSGAFRWSRNIQLMLRDESFLNRVIDPGAGCYFIEDWSNQIANKAWSIFQSIEQKGGYYACLESGLLGEMCNKSAAEQVAEVESGERILIGANAFRGKESDETSKPAAGRLASSVENNSVSTEKG